jgi:hypothetical protein
MLFTTWASRRCLNYISRFRETLLFLLKRYIYKHYKLKHVCPPNMARSFDWLFPKQAVLISRKKHRFWCRRGIQKKVSWGWRRPKRKGAWASFMLGRNQNWTCPSEQERRLVDSKVFWVRRGRTWPVAHYGTGAQESSLQSFVSPRTTECWFGLTDHDADLDLGQWQWAGSRAGCPKRYKLCPVSDVTAEIITMPVPAVPIAIWSSVAKSKFGQSLKFVGKIEKLLLN